jgi:NADP-dependent 3-hydroxy acid dehydrogenase YdfG
MTIHVFLAGASGAIGSRLVPALRAAGHQVTGMTRSASAIGAKPARRVPRWIARPLAGETIAVMMTECRGASNAKARRELGWLPRHRSWRHGFVHGLSG